MPKLRTAISWLALSLCLPAVCAEMLPGTLDTAAGTAAPAALPDAPDPQQDHPVHPVTEKTLIPAILKDQTRIWTSPARLRTHDLVWLVPLAAATGATLATDHQVMTSEVSHDRIFNKDNVNVSNYLLGGIIAVPVVLYGDGVLGDHSRPRETGLLSGEALGDGLIFQEVAKVIFRRERPLYDNAHGKLFRSTSITDGSFPSSHSVLAWATAAVVSEEYPGRWPTLGVYTAATAVSLTRVLGQEHFPTDVLVGSAAGWLIGHYVYKARHSSWVGHALKHDLHLAPRDPGLENAGEIVAAGK